MPERLLKQYASEVENTVDIHADERRKADRNESNAEKIAADKKARKNMFNTLKSMKNHNSGKLPSGFQNYWDAYRCDEWMFN